MTFPNPFAGHCRPIAAVLVACASAAAPAHGQSAVPAGTFELGRVSVNGREHAYSVWLPPGYSPREPRAAVLVLHGAGSRGADGLRPRTQSIAEAAQRHPDRYPAVLILPQCPEGTRWEGASLAIAMAALDSSFARLAIDRNRIYLAGQSMGGDGVFELASANPGRFAGAVIAAVGRGSPRFSAEALRAFPLWVFHGGIDPIPAAEPRRRVGLLEGAGSRVARFTEMEGRGHDIFDTVYQDPSVPAWLFAQRLQAAADTAELFGAGVFSTGDYELPPTFTPSGDRAWFTVSTPVYGRMRFILETRRRGNGWTTPTVASFSGRYDDADPYVSPDGSQLFFLSKRPVSPGGPPRRDLDIWVMDRRGDGWGEPRHLGPVVNGPEDEHYVTMTASGDLYIAAVREDSRGAGDLYRVPRSGAGWGAPENLGPVVNGAENHDTTPWVSPDGRYIIFASRGRPGGGPDLDLYITVRGADGAWTAPRSLGPRVNSSATELCPIVSHDGRWLYFTSTRNFADGDLGAAVGGDELRRLLRGPGNSLGDTYRIELAPLLREAGIH